MDKITVYTAITNGKDTLKEVVLPDVHFVAYIDDTINHVEGYEIREIRPFSDNPRLNAKIYKILPHVYLDCDISLWMDGAYQLRVDPRKLVDKFLSEHDMACFAHHGRSCIYEEAKEVVHLNLDYREVVHNQMKKYRQEGYPKGNGLIAGGFLLRRHTDKVKQTMEDWWKEILNHSHRDQLSFNYVAWKNGLKYSVIPGKGYPGKNYRSDLIKYTHHKTPRETYTEKVI